jgi:hypothetical protein
MMKSIPEFKSEEEVFEFWSKADSTEYIDWSKANRTKLANLKPTQFKKSGGEGFLGSLIAKSGHESGD